MSLRSHSKLFELSGIVALLNTFKIKMAENGGAKRYPQAGFAPMDVAIHIDHHPQPQEGSKCYDEDGKLKRTGEENNNPSPICFAFFKLARMLVDLIEKFWY